MKFADDQPTPVRMDESQRSVTRALISEKGISKGESSPTAQFQFGAGHEGGAMKVRVAQVRCSFRFGEPELRNPLPVFSGQLMAGNWIR